MSDWRYYFCHAVELILTFFFINSSVTALNPDVHEDKVNSYRVGNTRYNTKNGVASAIYNVGYVTKGDSVKAMTDDFLHHTFKDVLHYSDHRYHDHHRHDLDIESLWELASIRNTSVWTTVRYRQMYETIPVYDSDIAITINQHKKVVRMVSSKYKKGVYLDQNSLLASKRSALDIQSIAALKYGNGKTDTFQYISSPELMVYHETKGESKLAWRVKLTIKKSTKSLEVVFEDKSGDIMLEVDQTLDKQGRRLNQPHSSLHYLGTNTNITNSNAHISQTSRQILTEKIQEHKTKSKFKTSHSKQYRKNKIWYQRLLQPGIFNTVVNTIVQRISDFITDRFNLDTTCHPNVGVRELLLNAFGLSNSLENVIGNVYDPDPLSVANATYDFDVNCPTGFCDNDDSDSTELTAQLRERPLCGIKNENGTLYSLTGPYAQIVDVEEPFNGLFEQSSDDFRYTRGQDVFEAVNCYFHLDQAMRYVNHILGIKAMPTQYNGGIKFDPHYLDEDNSYFDLNHEILYFGTGGVDDGEDGEVIVHELGHAIHLWLTDGELSRVTGLSEGFSDYFASSYSRAKGLWTPDQPEYNWVFKWDGHNEFFSGRINNDDRIYPKDLIDNNHIDGQIWSSCNMEIWEAIGRFKSDTAHLLGISATNSQSNQEDLANAVYLASKDLGYTDDEINVIKDIYVARGYRVSDDVCGDGILGQFEECDGNQMGSASCSDVGCGVGIPSCMNCKVDYSTCASEGSMLNFKLELTFDGYPEETSWVLYNVLDNSIIDNGGQGMEYNELLFQSITESICLDDFDCYRFELSDFGADGMCCVGFSGDYNIYINNEPIDDETDPEFGSKVVHTFGNC